jgi:hypothetical protein
MFPVLFVVAEPCCVRRSIRHARASRSAPGRRTETHRNTECKFRRSWPPIPTSLDCSLWLMKDVVDHLKSLRIRPILGRSAGMSDVFIRPTSPKSAGRTCWPRHLILSCSSRRSSQRPSRRRPEDTACSATFTFDRQESNPNGGNTCAKHASRSDAHVSESDARFACR